MDKQELNNITLESIVRSIVYRDAVAVIKFKNLTISLTVKTDENGNSENTAKIERVLEKENVTNVKSSKFYELWDIVLAVISNNWYCDTLEIYADNVLACEIRKY